MWLSLSTRQCFKMNHITFEQDPVPEHKARTTQEWLKNHVPDFISANSWPAANPDQKTLDWKLRSLLESMICKKRHATDESLNQALAAAVTNLSIDCPFLKAATSNNFLFELNRLKILYQYLRQDITSCTVGILLNCQKYRTSSILEFK